MKTNFDKEEELRQKELKEREEKQNKENGKEQKPKTINKAVAILGVVLLCIGLILFLSCFVTNIVGGAPSSPEEGHRQFVSFGIRGFGGFLLIAVGSFLFIPVFTKYGAKYSNYAAKYAKEDLTNLANTSADITGPAVKKIAKSAKEGWEDETDIQDGQDTKFCSNCGKRIKKSANFCEHCGTKLD